MSEITISDLGTVVHVVAKQSEPVRISLFTFTDPDRLWTNDSLQDVETNVTILLLSTNFVDEGIRSCNVVVEDGLPSSRTVRSKLLFVSRKKPTVVILSDWRSNYFFTVIWSNRCFC